MARSRLRRYFRHGFFPQLLAFEACSRLGSVTRAAEELSLAQPTVSGLLKKLSDTVGTPVVENVRGRMVPTQAGQDLEILCEEVLAAFERFESRRRDMPEECEAEFEGPSAPSVPSFEHMLARVARSPDGRMRLTVELPS